MANKRKPGAKDPATKHTFNPPGNPPCRERDAQVQQPNTRERQPGQFTGEGTPSLQKK